MDIAELLYWKKSNMTISKISEETGIPENKLRYQYHKHLIKPFAPLSKWNLDRIKNVYDDEAQYVIGFLAADGYINTVERCVVIWIREQDIEVLFRIRNVLGNPGAPIHKRLKSGNCSDQVGLNIGSKKLVEYLKSEYGFTRTKSKDLPFPNIKNPMPYLRGYFDGNGHVNKQVCITTGSKFFFRGLFNFLDITYGYTVYTRSHNSESSFDLVFKREHYQFLNELFKIKGLERKSRNYELYSAKRRDRSRG